MTTSDAGGPEGLLVVDKPAGPTSHDIVSRVRRALGTRRVGHAGTLDPFATGLLACCVGRATRLVRFLVAEDKTYEGVIQLGWATDSGDNTGIALSDPRAPASLAAALATVAERLTGDLDQVPPMHSARKIAGVPLHRMARRGETVERQAARVRVRDWRIDDLGDGRLGFRVTCSAGTYVRVLAADLGEALGCGAHLIELRRTRSGSLRVEDALGGDALDRDAARAALIPIDRMPLALPRMRLDSETAVADILHGRQTSVTTDPSMPADADIAIEDPSGVLLGIGRVADGRLRPTTVLTGA